MRLIASPEGPFPQRLFFSTNEIDELCLEGLRLAGELPGEPRPIDVEKFIAARFSVTVDYRNLGPDVLGCTVFDELGSVSEVIVGDDETGSEPYERRIRSTVAHEAGHCLMHGVLFKRDPSQCELDVGGDNVDGARRRILCRRSDVRPEKRKPYDGRWWEWQANRAIGGLLLPRQLMRRALGEVLEVSVLTATDTLPASRKERAVEILSEVFDVNPVVARIRVEEAYPDQKQLTF